MNKTASKLILLSSLVLAVTISASESEQWQTDFFDDFDTFNEQNWQDQRIWVNNEDQCYVPDGQYGTRYVSEGTLKLKVIKLEQAIDCDNYTKTGEKHHDTPYVAGRIASKNRQEFVAGKWTARIRLIDNGQAGMFPAWWLLGAYNNEPPVQEPDETVCWPMVGSGEVDIFEHYGSNGPDHYAVRVIKGGEKCGDGDWLTPQKVIDAPLDDWHEYSAEWQGEDIVYRLDGKEVHRNVGYAAGLPEPFFAILNYAKVTADPMEGEWVMEVDWVKHQRLVSSPD